jgi:hypothetical protein
MSYIAADQVEWKHPHDFPPPHGVKLLLYTYPYGITIIGEWQNSGASLWSPLPKVPIELKIRLDEEYKRRVSDC